MMHGPINIRFAWIIYLFNIYLLFHTNAFSCSDRIDQAVQHLACGTLEMIKRLLTVSLAKPRRSADTILRNYKLFGLIMEKYITIFFL